MADVGTKRDWTTVFRAGAAASVDIIIPVYNACDEALDCIHSVLSEPQITRYRLVVVDDCSTDQRFVLELNRLAADGLFHLIRNRQNQGFVASVNIALNFSDMDVVLLNSDTIVYNDWLDRIIRYAKNNSRVASVTPFSNNAEICSYPFFGQSFAGPLEVDDRIIDELFSSTNAGKFCELPTGVGFCMFMSRAAIREIGPFDEAHFGRGYGEENDWCRRAVKAGWINVLAADTFVRHLGGTSFGDEKAARLRRAMVQIEQLHQGYHDTIRNFFAADPAAPLRSAVDAARLRRRSQDGVLALFVTHTLGGGTERHVQEMRRQAEQEGSDVLVARVDEGSGLMSIDPLGLSLPSLMKPIDVVRDLDRFEEFLAQVAPDFVHVHHAINAPWILPDLVRIGCEHARIPYYFTAHDYLPICPRVTMTNWVGTFCGEPDLRTCETCVRRHGARIQAPSVWSWRESQRRFLLGAEAIFCPSYDSLKRMRRYFPEGNYLLRPHADHVEHRAATLTVPKKRAGRRVVLLGAVSSEKGSWVLELVARAAIDMALDLEFLLIGHTDRPLSLSTLPNVTVLGAYKEEEALDLLRASNADFAWFPAVWPETFSFTLSRCLEANLPVVAFDLGAIAERVADANCGVLFPIDLAGDPRKLAAALSELAFDRRSAQLNQTLPLAFANYYRADITAGYEAKAT